MSTIMLFRGLIRPTLGSSSRIYNQVRCAGHAKWQNIAKTKTANDLNRGKMISRYCLMVRRAVIAGNRQTDPKLNSKLGDVLAEAAKLNVPKATLERAIERATNLKILSVNLEIQGPNGSVIIARCETENPSLLRREAKKSRGTIRAAATTSDGLPINHDFAEEAAIQANAEDVRFEDELGQPMWVFATDVNTLSACKGELEKLKLVIISSETELVPYRPVDFGEETYEKVVDVVKSLSEMEQVVEVFHNVVPPKVAEHEESTGS